VADYPAYDDDTPLTLKDACRVVFNGAITPSTLMTEHKRGRLPLEKIGGRYFVTPGYIKEMRNKCRLDPLEKDRDSTFNPSERTATAAPKLLGGSSGTARSSAALDALQLTLQELKRH